MDTPSHPPRDAPRHPPRLAVALLARAARRWPAELREDLHRAWLAELHAISTDPDTGRRAGVLRAVRFSWSLAVRRPAPSTAPVATPAIGSRPARELFGAALGVTIFGTLAAMLLVSLPAFVADRLPGADSRDALHTLPQLALVPVLAAVGVLVGRRLARRDAPHDVTRTVGTIVFGLCCARLLPMFGGVLTALPGLAVWAAGLLAGAAVAARLARRPRGPLPWMALGLGTLILADVAVTAAVWLSSDAPAAPRAYAWSWFPGALLDPAVVLPMGTGATGDLADFTVLDAGELLPHCLIVITAFTLAYVHATAARAPRPYREADPAPAR